MMQDYPKSLTGTKASVGFTVFDNWIGYQAGKEQSEDGKKKFDDGQPTTRRRRRSEFCQLASKILRLSGADIPEPKIDPKQKFNGMSFPIGSKVVLSPSFGCSSERVKSKINGLGHRSVLLVKATCRSKTSSWTACYPSKLKTDLKSSSKNLSVKNKSWNGTRNPTPRRKSLSL